MNHFYVYVYLDPRRPGNYTFPGADVSFLYEPFYVGKGGTERRKYSHLESFVSKKERNTLKSNKIKKILDSELKPFIEVVYSDLAEASAFTLEKHLISVIGRIDKKTGTLTNLTDGGDGVSGRVYSQEDRDRIRERLRDNHPFQGRHHKESTKELLRQRNLGKKFTEERKEAIKERFRLHGHPSKGRKLSGAELERVRTQNLGKRASEATRKHFSETRKGTGNSNAKYVFEIYRDDRLFTISYCLKDFCKEHGFNYVSVFNSMNKRGKYKEFVIVKRLKGVEEK